MLTSSNTVNTTTINNTTKAMDSNGFVNNSMVKKTGIVTININNSNTNSNTNFRN